MKVIEAVYEKGVFKPLKEDIKLGVDTRVFVIIPKKKKEEEIIKELRKLKDIKYPERRQEKVYYERYSG